MSRHHKKCAMLFVFCCCLAVAGCQKSTITPTPALAWQIQVAQFEIKDSLFFIESVTQYNGSKIDVTHNQAPAPGNVYLVVEATIAKTGMQAVPFEWQKLSVKDAAGNSYHRLENDTFLEQFQYIPRLTGLELRLGEVSGWMCFEVPDSAASEKLILSYDSEDSRQEIVLQR